MASESQLMIQNFNFSNVWCQVARFKEIEFTSAGTYKLC